MILLLSCIASLVFVIFANKCWNEKVWNICHFFKIFCLSFTRKLIWSYIETLLFLLSFLMQTLSLQRQMMENLIIAKARQDAVSFWELICCEKSKKIKKLTGIWLYSLFFLPCFTPNQTHLVCIWGETFYM